MDRITQILAQQAPAQNMQQAYALSPGNMNYAQYTSEAQMAPLRQEMGLQQIAQQQRAAQNAQMKALDDKINMFTAGDPEGNAMFLEALHADPEEIDPSNSYQVMSKLAGIAKQTGYRSPIMEQERRLKEAQIAKASATNNKPLSKEGKIGADVAAGYLTPEQGQKALNPNATEAGKAQEVQQSALEVVDRLLQNKEGVMANRGGISTLFPNISDSSVNAAADLDTLASLLTTENLGLLKGVLSDTDMKVLRDIGAGGLKGSDTQVLKNLGDIKRKLSQKLGTPVSAPQEPGELVGTSGGKKVYKITDENGQVRYVKER